VDQSTPSLLTVGVLLEAGTSSSKESALKATPEFCSLLVGDDTHVKVHIVGGAATAGVTRESFEKSLAREMAEAEKAAAAAAASGDGSPSSTASTEEGSDSSSDSSSDKSSSSAEGSAASTIQTLTMGIVMGGLIFTLAYYAITGGKKEDDDSMSDGMGMDPQFDHGMYIPASDADQFGAGPGVGMPAGSTMDPAARQMYENQLLMQQMQQQQGGMGVGSGMGMGGASSPFRQLQQMQQSPGSSYGSGRGRRNVAMGATGPMLGGGGGQTRGMARFS